jgi:hypothetical protein
MIIQNHFFNDPFLASLLNIQQIHSAIGPATHTVKISRVTTVRSVPPHLLSAFAYSCHSRLNGVVP